MRLIFCTIHPAPYFDRLFAYLQAHDVATETWYVEARNAEKEWKTYVPEGVHLYSEASLLQKAQQWAHADFVVLPWAQRESMMIALWLWLCRCRFAFYLDHPDPQHTKATGVMRFAKRMLMHMATYMFPACPSCADYLRSTYGLRDERLRVFPYTHSPRPNEQDAINETRAKALRMGDKPRLLIASRFVERKGYATVLNAFRQLAHEGLLDQFDITIVGSGEQRERYQTALSALSSNIKFYGWVENDEYEHLLSQTDIYLHPSIFEPFGIPPLDAMERGKMLICTSGVKSTDIFTNCAGVYIVEPADNAEGMANALRDCLSKRSELYRLAHSNPELCQKQYGVEVNLKALTL